MGDVYYNSTWYLQTFQGQGTSLLHVPPPPNSGIMIHYPPQGTVFFTNNASPGGLQGLTPREVVNLGLEQGATLIATSISLLTSKGQVLTSNGQNNVVVNPGSDGQVLQADSSNPNGLSWISPAAASGVVPPTPGTIPQRDGTGNINAVGFTTTGPILASGSQAIGSVGTPFTTSYVTTVNATTVNATTISNASILTLAAPTVNLTAGGVPTFTATATAMKMLMPLALDASVPLVIGGNPGVVGTWRIVLVGTSPATSISFQYCASSNVYTEMGGFGPA